MPDQEHRSAVFKILSLTVLCFLATILMFLPLQVSLIDTVLIAAAVIVATGLGGLILDNTTFDSA